MPDSNYINAIPTRSLNFVLAQTAIGSSGFVVIGPVLAPRTGRYAVLGCALTVSTDNVDGDSVFGTLSVIQRVSGVPITVTATRVSAFRQPGSIDPLYRAAQADFRPLPNILLPEGASLELIAAKQSVTTDSILIAEVAYAIVSPSQ